MQLITISGREMSLSEWVLRRLHLDPVLLGLLLVLLVAGLGVLYSASGGNLEMIERQLLRIGVGLLLLFVFAQVPLHVLRTLTPWLFFVGLALLVAVMGFGEVGKGARRWLDLGFMRFQPSEVMKLAVPMMLALWFAWRGGVPRLLDLLVAALLLALPALLIFRQPDLGTALLVTSAGAIVIFFSGLQWRWILGLLVAIGSAGPIAWTFLLDYQRQRVLTLFNPESDPLGAGYHIIQSKIAIGSGGVFGKGWLNGTQSQLEFLPERSTDFIFAVYAEEFGLMGILLLLVLYAAIVLRGLAIARASQDRFGQLVAASVSLTFAVYAAVNMGMVSGLFPVVGIPLPLISYGGTSLVTLLIGFGILMAVHSQHRKVNR